MDVQVTGLCLSDRFPLLGMACLKHFPLVLMWQFIVLAACRIFSAGLAAEEFTSVFKERGTPCLQSKC